MKSKKVKNNKNIYVTQPNLPPLHKLQPYLKKIWENKILTNNGPFHQKFEKKLSEYLEVENVNLFTNATIALMVGIKALGITGEVITTPFSFVATTHALVWNGIKPVFCDIEEETLNIDPRKIEALITPLTTAIMPVHVFGRPCDIDKIQAIADKYGLKVIYDAAHAFGVKLKDKNLLLQGNMSILSFHATKLFNTFEGGAIITKDKNLKNEIDYLKNFGFLDEVTVIGTGINGKMNEFQSIIGILSLDIVEKEIIKREKIAKKYIELLKGIEEIKLFDNFSELRYNYAYFPILINDNKKGVTRDDVYYNLRKENIFARRYFYPLISNMNPYKNLPSSSIKNLQIANKISSKILCLPLFGSLSSKDILRICNIIKKSIT